MNEHSDPANKVRIGDAALAHLRQVSDQPDVSGTRYEVLAPLGRGGMGAVWRARDLQLDREVALKVSSEHDPEFARALEARLADEAKVLAKLEHPGIVPVHDVGQLPDGRAFYAMKLVRGSRLDELVRAGLPIAESLRIFARIAEAVAFAHSRGVIHRDLKPTNVMVGEFGEVLVLDWGLARGLLATEPIEGDERAGTVGFMAPEQQRGGQVADVRSDVFALGRVLATFRISGRAMTAIVAKATAEQPSDRYGGVGELAEDVARFQTGDAVRALREGLLTRLGRWYRKYKIAVWLVASYALLRIGFEIARLWFGNSR